MRIYRDRDADLGLLRDKQITLYMSGELSYTMLKIAEVGMVEQSALHSHTSQYGSMSRGMRFMLPELRVRLREGLADIRSGRFAAEWAAEQEAGCPTLKALREAARSLPLYRLERELREALGDAPPVVRPILKRGAFSAALSAPQQRTAFVARAAAWLRGLWGRRRAGPGERASIGPLDADQVERVLRAFLAHAAKDPALQAFAQGSSITTHYVLRNPEIEFYLRFENGKVSGELGPPGESGRPPAPAEVRIRAEAEVLDGMLTGRIHAMRAAMTGQLVFSGDTRLAVGIQRIQGDLCRLYQQARREVVT
jgi:hypothetical protein